MNYRGDYRANQMVDIPFPSQGLDGASITLGTDGTVRVYKNNSVTQRTSLAGVTFSEDFDGVTGWHHLRIDTANDTDAGFYASGNDFSIGVVGAVVDGKTVNTPIGCWSIENRSALRPTTAGETLDVTAGAVTTTTPAPTPGQIADEVQTRTIAAVTTVGIVNDVAALVITKHWAAAVRELSASGNTAVASAVSTALASAFSAIAPGLVADALLDELLADHVIAGSLSAGVATIISAIDPTGAADIDALLALLATRAEPGQGAPPVTATPMQKVDYIYKFLRNKVTQDATTLKVFADDGTTVDHKATVSDDATTYTRGEVGSGP